MTAITERLSAALAGRYRIEKHLGEGGMASVYLCDDLKHDRKVAVKVLKPDLAAVLGADRFIQEIKTTAALSHPHILPLFDSGTADSFLFYVMPYIQGETIREKLNRESQFGIEEAVRIAREVADALDYAHRHGVIHRDVKPENILLHDGRAMVMDFGIALAVSAAAGGRMTETGLSLGTPHYMSPEQATAEKALTPRSDVYSLGTVLYEMLAGEPPHVGGSAQAIIMKIVTDRARPVTDIRKSVPAHVAAAVAKAVETLPADRFESAAKFAEALGNPGYTYATMAGAGTVSRVQPRKGARLIVALGLVALVAMGAAVWGWLRPAPPPTVTRDRIVLWDNQQIPVGSVGRGLAISPDGGTVVFADRVFADRGGPGAQLFTKDRDRLDATALAGATGVAGGPAFSPDGAWIAFVGTDGRVKKVPRLGGSPIPIADSAFIAFPAIAWLEDGTILFLDVRSGIRAVSAEGGVTRQVLSGWQADSTPRLVRYLAGLPGGRGALFVQCPAACVTSDLRVVDLRAAKPRVAVLADQVLAGWALPGNIVVFVRRDGGVFAAPFDAGTLTFSRPPTPVLDGIRSTNTTADMALAAGGMVIYVPGGASAGAEAVEPVWVTRSGAVMPLDTAWTVLVPERGTLALGKRLALSPQGDRLALGILRPGSTRQSDIWVKQLDRAPFTLTKVTFESDNANPVWTPDGRSLMYTSGGLTVPGLLRRRRADGSGAVDTLLALARGINDVVLTPDSSHFVLREIGPPSRDIVEWKRGDSTVVPMMASPAFNEIAPALSPDGRWLAYASDESGQYEVYVRPYPNWAAGRWQVSQAGGQAPAWAHTGRELFYQNGAGALMSAAVLPGSTFTMGAHTRLFDASGFVGTTGALYYDVAPDDKRFVLLRRNVQPGTTQADRLAQITNWAAEVRAKLEGKAPR